MIGRPRSPSSDPRRRILVLSSRPDVLAAVITAASTLEPAPSITNLLGRPGDLQEGDLILVDVGESGATAGFLRASLGPHARLVALLDSAWVDRLGEALAGDWYDYLFYPISAPELGLVWRRHVGGGEARGLSVDVDDEGHLRMSVPAKVTYQRPAVERIVQAGIHLAGLDSDAAFRVRVALGEAVANAILYGGRGDSRSLVHLEAFADEEAFRVCVRDEGAGFDPSRVSDPTSAAGLERPSGRGLLLMRSLADEISFDPAGCQVMLTFRGAVDPLARLGPWLEPFSQATGLKFRLERDRADRTDVLYDSWDTPEAATPRPPPRGLSEQTLTLSESEHLRLLYEAADSRSSAGPLLGGLLGALIETRETRERWVERRLRRERVLAELEVARDLQLRLLPDAGRFVDLAEIAVRCDPALSLGGDFYFLSRLSEGRLGVMLGDVSSHGPSAALIMALTLSAAAMVAKGDTGPAQVLDGMREQLLRALEKTEMYMTLFYAVVDRVRGVVSYANAGHPYAYRLAENDASRLGALDPPVGMGAAMSAREETVTWSPGSHTLLAFTDGLTHDLADPVTEDGSAICRCLAAGELDPASLVASLFDTPPEGLRLDDRTAVAVRP